jgi:hypothetical protein
MPRSSPRLAIAAFIAIGVFAAVLLSTRGGGEGAVLASPPDTASSPPPVEVRPARVKPGDPELRVPTEPSLASVRVELPFEPGPREAVLDPESRSFVLRFLVPPGWPDGAWQARVLLAYGDGRTEERSASIRVDTQPAAVAVLSVTEPSRPGERLLVRMKPAVPVQVLARAAGAPGGAASALRSAMEVKEILVRAPWGEVASARMEGPLGVWEAELHVPRWSHAGPVHLEIVASDAAGNASRRGYDATLAAPLVAGWSAAGGAGLLAGALAGMAVALRRRPLSRPEPVRSS